VNQACKTMHHDALELPNGQIVLLTRLCEGQIATVIQLPASAFEYAATEHEVSGVAPARLTPR
jgi:hypothetical protein